MTRRTTVTPKKRATSRHRYDNREAQRAFMKIQNQQNPEAYGDARLRAANELVVSVCRAAAAAGYKVRERDDSEWVILGKRGSVSIKAYMNAGIVVEARSDGVTHDIGAAHIDYDPLDDVWVGTRDDERGVQLTAAEAVARRVVEGLRNV
jgi:hypothetical protein